MQKQLDECEFDQVLDQVLGYLNFSLGAEDENFLGNLNQVFAHVDSGQNATGSKSKKTMAGPPHSRVAELLKDRLNRIKSTSSAFADSQQAARVIDLVFFKALPGYLDYHRDLLFHRNQENTFNSFFVGRVCEVVLASRPMELEAGSMIKAVNAKLNDFIGHRPLPTLETQKVEPYPNEWVRPIPLFIRGVGVAHGQYHELISEAIRLLSETSTDLLDVAHFHLDHLKEMSLDPRAYDFDHPINRRPNFHFGQWDEQSVSQDGYFERFIVHEVTLESLLSRVNSDHELPRQELLIEAATVLGGTILMAAGISGRGPGAFDSTVTLTDLLPRIAGYRDEFYEQMLGRMEPGHSERLKKEAETRHQSFGSVRQHLNNHLAGVRSEQMVRTHLAMIFARMGYDTAAEKQADIVPVCGSRILCKIDCYLARGRLMLQTKQLTEACEAIPAMMEMLRRGIQCGAIVDPWNILGFDTNYSLFPAAENSVRDHRVDELVDLMEQIINFCSRVWIAAAGDGNLGICERVSSEFEIVTDWWRQFAAHEVESVDSIDPMEIYNASRNVAGAIQLAQKQAMDDDANGSISLWSKHAELFQSPRAFALTVDAMIDQQDYSTSMGLLIYWLSEAERIPLEYGESSFCNLVNKWLQGQTAKLADLGDSSAMTHESLVIAAATWDRFRKFYDRLEANAETYWDVPQFDLNRGRKPGSVEEVDEHFDEEPEESIYDAAYEDVVYIDTTDDGIDGSIDDGGGDDELSEDVRLEADRISDRLNFLEITADLFKIAATMIPMSKIEKKIDDKSLDGEAMTKVYQGLVNRQMDSAEQWIKRATSVCEKLDVLTGQVEKYRLPAPNSDHHSLMDYDRQRHYKESLIDQVISINVEFENARQMLAGWLQMLRENVDVAEDPKAKTEKPGVEDEVEVLNAESSMTDLFAAILGADRKEIPQALESVIEVMSEQPILYVPLSKGGKSKDIRDVRARQCALGELLDCLPRLGFFKQTYELTQLILMMERNQKTRSGAVTEFDELFRISYSAMIESLVSSTNLLEKVFIEEQGLDVKEARENSESALFECMEMLTESMLMIWLSHSHTLRLSVLEKIPDQPSWERLKDFIEEYGKNLLTQTFLNLTNVRAILHQGVDQWLDQVAEEPDSDQLALIRDLDTMVPRKLAVKYLTLILEAVVENFTEYRDYNSTTTQSDRGEMLYVLIDFLRLRCKYERVCWRLKPVIWAHETLVRNNQANVARMWRRSLTERVGMEAERFVDEYQRLRDTYSIQMVSVFDRLNEKFVHPMQVDRLCSLVESAMSDPQSQNSQRIFDLVEHQANSLAAGPNGSGIDVPAWITSLNEEVERVSIRLSSGLREPQPLVSSDPLPLAQLREQIETLPRRQP